MLLLEQSRTPLVVSRGSRATPQENEFGEIKSVRDASARGASQWDQRVAGRKEAGVAASNCKGPRQAHRRHDSCSASDWLHNNSAAKSAPQAGGILDENVKLEGSGREAMLRPNPSLVVLAEPAGSAITIV
jgi:hypothetical protein